MTIKVILKNTRIDSSVNWYNFRGDGEYSRDAAKSEISSIDKKDVDFSQSFNEKYVKYVEEFDLDKEVWEVSGIGERDPFVYDG